MTALEVKLSISDEVLAYPQREAEERNVSLDVFVNDETLEVYFDESSDEEILVSTRTGVRQALTGDYRPAHEVLDELKNEENDLY